MKALRWIGITLLLTLMSVFVINSSFGDKSADDKYLYIVQSELEQNGSVLNVLSENRKLLPVTEVELTKQNVHFTTQFSVTDKNMHTVDSNLSFSADMYTAENAMDYIVTITNTGNVDAYVRTWFAFEMGDLSEEEFKSSLILNQNSAEWTWGDFSYGTEIDGKHYAVVCVKYNEVLFPGQTTPPSLLQILLKSTVTNDIAARLDGNSDGEYEVRAHSQAVSDDGAWSQIGAPW